MKIELRPKLSRLRNDHKPVSLMREDVQFVKRQRGASRFPAEIAS